MAIMAILHRATGAKAAQDGSGENSSASPTAASTKVMVVPKSREATPSGPAGGGTQAPAEESPTNVRCKAPLFRGQSMGI